MDAKEILFVTASAVFYVDWQDLVQMSDNIGINISPTDEAAKVINRRYNRIFNQYGYSCGRYLPLTAAYNGAVKENGGQPPTKEMFERQIIRRAKTHLKFIRDEERRAEEWANLNDTFDGHILGVERDIDFRTDRDFCVRVSLRSGNYYDHLAYIQRNRDRIIRYVLDTLQSRPRAMKRIGDFGFYRLSSMTVTRTMEIELIFSVKEKLVQLLADA